jgi:hypothetical protein
VASIAAAAATLAVTACLDVGTPGCSASSIYHPLTLGATVTDSFTSQVCIQFYQVPVGGQTNLAVSLKSPGLQSFLQLLDSSGAIRVNSVLTSTLDTVTNLRVELGHGSYTLAVVPYNTGQSGRYSFVAAKDTSPVAGCGMVWLTAGDTTTQTITHADCTQGPGGTNFYYHVYALLLRSGDVINATEHSTALAPAVTLVGPDGTQTSTLDSLGTTATLSTQIESQGAYRLWVGSSTAAQVGTYKLQIQ